MVDVFDENDILKVVAELRDVNEKEIRIDIERNILTISTNSSQKNIPLFCSVNRIIEKTYKNGVLEVVLEKNR